MEFLGLTVARVALTNLVLLVGMTCRLGLELVEVLMFLLLCLVLEFVGGLMVLWTCLLQMGCSQQ
jgi:hypothetical protein